MAQHPPPPPSGNAYFFKFSGLRGGLGTHEMQLAEIKLYGVGGAEISVLEISNPGGIPGNSWETAASAVDGNLATKWLDLNITKPNGQQQAFLLLLLAAAQPVASYDLFTANQHPNRDPTDWSFGVYRQWTPTEEGEAQTESLETLHQVAGHHPHRPLRIGC